MQFGLHVLFGTLVGQVYAADRALVPEALMQGGTPSSDGMAHRFGQWTEHQDEAARVSSFAVSRVSASVESPRTSLSPAELDGRLVFDCKDLALGKVTGFTPSYVEVATPTLDIGPRLYLPFDAFGYCSPAGCYLRYSLEQISTNGWNQAPGVVAVTEPGSAESEDRETEGPGPIAGVVEPAPGILIPYFTAEEAARLYMEQRAS